MAAEMHLDIKECRNQQKSDQENIGVVANQEQSLFFIHINDVASV